MTDRYFDQIGAHFARKIYASPKGAIRLAVLTRDLEQWMQGLASDGQPLRVLDVGAGLGHVSEWLLSRGHHLTVSEPSQEMLEAILKCHSVKCLVLTSSMSAAAPQPEPKVKDESHWSDDAAQLARGNYYGCVKTRQERLCHEFVREQKEKRPRIRRLTDRGG